MILKTKVDITGGVCWITGLSGAGKTTLAKNIYHNFKKKSSNHSILLDGDALRKIFSNKENENYNRKGRVTLALKYSKLCHMLSKQNLTVIIATISLYKEVQKWNRENISNYYEVFLDVPLEELKRRDPKRIYERFFLGEIKNVAGLDVDIDLPINADFVVKNGKINDNESLANQISQILIEKGFA